MINFIYFKGRAFGKIPADFDRIYKVTIERLSLYNYLLAFLCRFFIAGQAAEIALFKGYDIVIGTIP